MFAECLGVLLSVVIPSVFEKRFWRRGRVTPRYPEENNSA